MKTLFRLLLRWLYRFRTENEAVLKTPGPVLLVPNHVTWLDWLFLLVCLDDDWRFVTSKVTAQTTWLHRLIMVNRHTFPIDTTSPYAVKRMAEYLQTNGRLVLFAEGRLSTSGTLMKLYDGTGFLLYKTRAKIITCYLRGAHRLPWVKHRGWTQWFPRISAHFSPVLTPPQLKQVSTAQARGQLTRWLRDKLVEHQFQVEMELGKATVLEAILETARRHPRQVILEDLTRQQLTYRRLMMGIDLLARQWDKRLARGAERVGVLLPNVNAMPLVILSLWARAKSPAVLNYSTGWATLLDCARLAGLKQVITSRDFLQRVKFPPEGFAQAGLELIYLEEVRAGMSRAQKAAAMIRGWMPGWRLEKQARQERGRSRPPAGAASGGTGKTGGSDDPRSDDSGHSPARVEEERQEGKMPTSLASQFAWRHIDSQASALILFTSGSEGMPKGVELTHGNLLANIRQTLAVTDITDGDRLFNALPLFHSFGLTVGTLLPLVRGLYVFLYPSPLHYRMVPALVYDRDCTIFLSTNTFLNGYARKANPYDFRTVRYLVAGAEQLQEATANIWARRFGIRVLEGYGATECSPCITANTPLAACYGSAGRFLPGIEYRLEPVEGVAEGGRLLVRGPNVMRAYLNADANAKFQALDGWYDTGDIVKVDADGFVHILGRLKRFAKISGEMVSLTAVEDALAGAFPNYGLRCQVAVLSRSDEEKGEALVAVTNEPRLQLAEIRAVLKAKGFSNLCVPREVRTVREIPKLGTGKVNHRELVKLL